MGHHFPAVAPTTESNPFLDVIVRACDQQAQAMPLRLNPDAGAFHAWTYVFHPAAAMPIQGWKLHVSASAWSAESVLERALRVLLAEPTNFKVASSPSVLRLLNRGEYGLSQIGKFITVYPTDEAQAIRLAAALDRATYGLRGPSVPTDHPFREGSLVSYRYGDFIGQDMQLLTGEIVPAMTLPSGVLAPDERGTCYRAPEWVADPFPYQEVLPQTLGPGSMLSGTYVIVAELAWLPRGATYLAADIRSMRRCVLKGAHPNATLAADGRDARDFLRHEAAILAHLAPDPRIPMPFELITYGDQLFLAMEDIEGETLDLMIAQRAGLGDYVSSQDIIAIGRAVASILEMLHAKGIAYRDLKSTNLIRTPQGQMRLIDFGTAHALPDQNQPLGLGSRGYRSQAASLGYAVTEDVYGLGALLYFVATGAEPALAPHEFTLLDRPLALMHPALHPALADVIARCLDPEPARRFPSMAAVDAALAAIEPVGRVIGGVRGSSAAFQQDAMLHYREWAEQLGDALCKTAHRDFAKFGHYWQSTHPSAAGGRAYDLNVGSAGALLALAEVVGALKRSEHREVLEAAAYWLATSPPLRSHRLPGLYVGECGIGASLLRAGQVLGDQALIAAAAERGCWAASQPYRSPDLFVGTAGRLRFHLLLWEATAESLHLEHALQAGAALLAAATPVRRDEVCWPIPPGYGASSGQAYLGYAHGAAGIADALLDLFDVSGDKRFRLAARSAAHWLVRQAIPALPDRSGIHWPMSEGEPAKAAFWCHGAAGIGQFFLHAAAHELVPDATALAARAARTVAQATRWAGPTQCHGLSGSIELLLDMAQATGEAAYVADAHELALLLDAFAVEHNGMIVCSSDVPTTITPDYMVGYAGVAACLLRLAAPMRLPRQLSRAGFRYRH